MTANGVGSGTGANYAVILGAFQAMMDDGFEPESWVGVSGSAMVMALMACGYTPRKILNIAKAIGPVDIIRPSLTTPFVPGVFHLDRMRKALRRFIPATIGESKLPITIICHDSDTEEEVQFSTLSTPSAPFPAVIQASTSIPWMFRHVKVNGRRLTDGGVVHNFPIDVPQGQAVGVRVQGVKHDPAPWKWWGSYSLNHVDAMMRAAERAHISRALWEGSKILTVQSPISGLDFLKLDDAMLDRLFAIGYRAVQRKTQTGWAWK